MPLVRRVDGAVVGPVLLAAAWIYTVRSIVVSRGLFDWIAYDFGILWAVTRSLLLHGVVAAYDPGYLAEQVVHLAPFYGPDSGPLHWSPFAYPAAALLIFGPVGLLPPVASYLVWTAANAALALHVIWQLVARFHRRRWQVAATALCFYPLVDCLLQGQVAVLLMFALYRAYTAFERGQEGRAGLWAGLLLLKPQYAVGLALVLVLMRRRRALAGFTATGAALAATSLAMLGPTGLPVYLKAVGSVSSFRDYMPHIMINWRALLVTFLPGDVPEAAGLLLTGLLGLATLGALALVWRGPWRPDAPSFAPRVLATLIATLLAAPHSHAHGATLLLVPGLILAGQELPAPLLRGALRAAAFLPSLAFVVLRDPAPAAIFLIVFMLASYGAVIAMELPRRRGVDAGSLAHAPSG